MLLTKVKHIFSFKNKNQPHKMNAKIMETHKQSTADGIFAARCKQIM